MKKQRDVINFRKPIKIQDITPSPRIKTSDWIAIGSIVVNIIIVIIALQSLHNNFIQLSQNNAHFESALTQTKKSIAISEHANKIAQQNYQLARRAFDSSIKISKLDLNEQVNQLKTSQENFEAINRPYIFINAINTTPIRQNAKQVVNLNFQNHGKFPALVLFINENFKLYPSNKYFYHFTYNNDSKFLNVFLPSGQQFDAPIVYFDVDKEDYASIVKKNCHFLFTGK